MIDQHSTCHTGWARFSDDMQMRYRLARSLVETPLVVVDGTVYSASTTDHNRCVFLMLNPSTADAFQLDPTVRRCVAFARAWGADVLEVVNLFALRSTDPDELYKRAHGARGDDEQATRQLLAACSTATRVVAAWGVHGALDQRGQLVRGMLHTAGIRLCHLGLTKDGYPRHPLYITGGTLPQEWSL